MNGAGTSIGGTKIPKSAFFRNRAGTVSKQQTPEPEPELAPAPAPAAYHQPQYRLHDPPNPHPSASASATFNGNGAQPLPSLPNPNAGPSDYLSSSYRDRQLPPPPIESTFERAAQYAQDDFAPSYEDDNDDEPTLQSRDDRFTPMPSRSTRRARSTRQDRLARDALESPPLTVRVENEGGPRQGQGQGHAHSHSHSHAHAHAHSRSGGSGGSGASGSGLSLGLSGLESSTSTAATALTVTTPGLSPTMGSDEMLFALLAGQAAVDCSQLPIGGWEEVEGWKKELQLLSTRLEALQARHQREVKILAAARTLQRLNSAHRRMSKATMESLEQSERRVAESEKEVLILRDREAALRRQLMEHWAGVMAWEVRRLEKQAADASLRHEQQMLAVAREREAAMAGGSRGPGSEGHARGLSNGDAEHQREQELLSKVRALEAERDENAEKVRMTEAELDHHVNRARTLDNKLREVEDERDQQAEKARSAQTELDRHATRARTLDTEREQYTVQTRGLETERDQHASRIRELETERDAQGRRISELEQLLRDFGTRERTLQENAEAAERTIGTVNAEREEWERERSALVAEREELITERDDLLKQRDSLNRERDDMYHKHGALVAESAQASRARDKLIAERDAWTKEKESLVSERDGHVAERTRLAETADRATTYSRTIDGVCTDLGTLLGHKVEDYELSAAVDEIRALQDKREREVAALKDELREVTHSLETEISRISADRDAMRSKAEESSGSSARAMQVEMTELVRKLRSQNDTIADLQGQLNTKPQSNSADEIARINGALAKAWQILPSPNARAESGLKSPVMSPNSPVNFAALQKAYLSAPEDEYTGINDLISRIRGVVDDGRLMAERMSRMDIEKERHKANAARAAKLVTDSRSSLETYQQQVDILKERLEQLKERETASASDLQAEVTSLRAQLDSAQAQIAHLSTELNTARRLSSNSTATQNEVASLQRELRDALTENRKLGAEIAARSETIARLNEVNSQLSSRTLAMADDAENDKKALSHRHALELEDERTRFMEQRVQMLDEMNSLQEEVGQLRAKLRR